MVVVGVGVGAVVGAVVTVIGTLKAEYPDYARAIEWAQRDSTLYGRQLLVMAMHLRRRLDKNASDEIPADPKDPTRNSPSTAHLPDRMGQ